MIDQLYPVQPGGISATSPRRLRPAFMWTARIVWVLIFLAMVVFNGAAIRAHIERNAGGVGGGAAGLKAAPNEQLGDPYTATLVVTNTDSLGIDIEISADRSAAQHGEVISYTYRISNTGSVELENVVIEDEGFGQSFIIGEFAPGRIEVRGYGLIVNNDVFPGPIENTAVVTGVDSEGEPVSDSDTLSIPITGYKLRLPRLSSQGPEE